jgi:hypothetical protein
MSNFPNSLDDDVTLPVVTDNITEIGGEAINSLRDATFAIEQELGIGGSGTSGSVASRISVSLNPDGTIKSAALTDLGLVTLPITNSQISSTAGILESKLSLDYPTLDLYNYIKDLSLNIKQVLGWISVSGVKLDPHISGAIYRHELAAIDVSYNTDNFLKNSFGLYRDNESAYSVIKDINSELLSHQFADGSSVSTKSITTNNGSSFSANYSHTSSGIYLNSSGFAWIPKTIYNLQSFAEYVDQANILGDRMKNLYSNGISRSIRIFESHTNHRRDRK